MASSSASKLPLPTAAMVSPGKSCAECLAEISALASRIANICTGAQSVTSEPQVSDLLTQLSYTVAVQQQVIEEFAFTLFGRSPQLLQQHQTMAAALPFLAAQQAPLLMAASSSSMTRIQQQQPQQQQQTAKGAGDTAIKRQQSGEQDVYNEVDDELESDDEFSVRAEAGQAETPSASGGALDFSGGEPGYECDLCPKRLASLAAMRQHRYIHDASPRFACEMCGKAFKQSAGLYQHKRVVHKND